MITGWEETTIAIAIVLNGSEFKVIILIPCYEFFHCLLFSIWFLLKDC